MNTKTIRENIRTNADLTRRSFLNVTWIAALVLLIIKSGSMVIDLLKPRSKEGALGGVFTVSKISQIPSQTDPPVNFPEGQFWLVHQGDLLRAFYKSCTHLDCLFKWNNQEKTFICPCHGSQFDSGGRLLSGPAPRSLDEFVVQIVLPDGKLHAETHPEKGLKIPQIEIALSSENNESSGLLKTKFTESDDKSIPADSIVRVDTGRKIVNIFDH